MEIKYKQQIEEYLKQIRSIRDELRKIYGQEQIENLDSAIDELADAMGYLEDALEEDSEDAAADELVEEDMDVEASQPGFLSKLMVGILGAETMQAVKRNFNLRVQEEEQERQDSLFWQDSARRKDPAYSDFVDGVDNDWDFHDDESDGHDDYGYEEEY